MKKDRPQNAPSILRAPPSVWKLVLRVYSDLLLALIIGGVLGAPVVTFGPSVHSYTERTEVSNLPADDRGLETWGRAQPGVRRFDVLRHDRGIEVQYRRFTWD